MGFAHGYHHEKDGVGLNAEDDFLLSLCFCPSCLAGAAKAGVDGEAARALTKQWIVETCEQETSTRRFPDFPARGLETFRSFPALYDYLVWRATPVTSLIADIRARAHPASRIVLIDLAEGWLGGCDHPAIAKVCDGAILCVYSLAPEPAGAVVAAGRAAFGPDKFLGAGFRLFPGDVDDADTLTRLVSACTRAGAVGLNFYNYGLIPARRLDWIRTALGKA
jgi:hypothetical protein